MSFISLTVLIIFTIVKIMSLRKPSLFLIVRTESKRKYVCRVYHQLLQYIAKLRQITIDLYIMSRHMRNSKKSQPVTAFAIVEKYIGIVTNFLILQSFQITWHKPPRKVLYKRTFGTPDQGQTLDVWGRHPADVNPRVKIYRFTISSSRKSRIRKILPDKNQYKDTSSHG